MQQTYMHWSWAVNYSGFLLQVWHFVKKSIFSNLVFLENISTIILKNQLSYAVVFVFLKLNPYNSFLCSAIEAIQRAAAIAEIEGSPKIEATHLERILPQLLLDF